MSHVSGVHFAFCFPYVLHVSPSYYYSTTSFERTKCNFLENTIKKCYFKLTSGIILSKPYQITTKIVITILDNLTSTFIVRLYAYIKPCNTVVMCPYTVCISLESIVLYYYGPTYPPKNVYMQNRG